jgi:hypothetical protein
LTTWAWALGLALANVLSGRSLLPFWRTLAHLRLDNGPRLLQQPLRRLSQSGAFCQSSAIVRRTT